mmetsp:Transcript_9782/g.12023  ORF Transcript_9782/g.12023 Transcript_9782/m.12023 type:complete len:147 (-) Transcript_9782:653-1093(-)
MNCVEHSLPELELSTGQVREALQCILHTILFIRAPGPVAPRDIHCEGFDLTYTRISNVSYHQSNPSPMFNHRGGPRSSSVGGISPTLEISNMSDVDKKVDEAIENFLQKLAHVGPELLKGSLTLSFFERRATRQLFGLVSHEERVV